MSDERKTLEQRAQMTDLERLRHPGSPHNPRMIAGTTWSKKDSAIVPKGATAFGVRLLERFVADHYENK